MIKKIRVAVLFLNMIGLVLLTGCGNDLYAENTSGYTETTCVKGVSFDMPSSMLDQATAVTNISEDLDYSGNAYVYKNGSDTYLMFDISSVVVAVKANTTYGFVQASDMEEAMLSEGLNGIWFEKDGKELDYISDTTDNVFKIIMTVNADVSITSDVYGVFSGKLASVCSPYCEYTMFVGARSDSYEELTTNQKEIVEHIARSFTITDPNMSFQVAEISTETSSTESTEIIDNNDIDNDVVIINPEPDNAESTGIENTETTETKTETKKMEEGSDAVENSELNSEQLSTEVVETIPDDTELPEDSEEKDTEDDVHPDFNDIQENEKDESDLSRENQIVTVGSNQKEREEGSYFSSIYSMLSVGDTGQLLGLSYETGKYSDMKMVLNAVYTGEEAENIIKEHCQSSEAKYTYEKAPDGCSWNVIEYTLSESPEDLYVNICIEGLDGEKLKYRGVSYSKRTHDIFSKMVKTEDGYSKLYCYYAVPNGCTEYLIEAGDPGVTDMNAFYHIIVKK